MPDIRAGSGRPIDAAQVESGKRFRPDIEGLRAIAVGVVLLYHAGITFVPGGFIGVDIFFVISGFLITGLLVREVEKTGRVSLLKFYARRARRLLPAATLVLVFTAVMMWLTASSIDWRTAGGDIVASALYVENWMLAARSVDYLAEGAAASPVQHYWSLSVEEQFYVVWPLLLLVAIFFTRKFGWRIRPVMSVALALIVIPSFVWSVIATDQNPQAAYFVTTTRLWELGVGAVVAVSAGLWAKIPVVVARILGWCGLVTLVASALLLDASVAWPGSLALLPVLGTTAVIISGTAHPGGVGRVLGLKPMVWIGGLSYALYLWHWPLLIGVDNIFGEQGWKVGLAVIAATFVIAWLSTRFVENPVRFSKRLSSSSGTMLSVGLNLTVVAVASGLILMLAVPTASAQASSSSIASKGGATLTYDATSITGVKLSGSLATMVPSPSAARDDVPPSSNDGCSLGFEDVAPKLCSIGAEDGEITIVVAGDSKIQQWSDVLGTIAREQGWKMLLATKSACAFTDALRERTPGTPYTQCPEYNAALLQQLVEMRPDVVLTSQRHNTAFIPGTTEYSADVMRDALAATWTTLEEKGTHVVALLDNPSPTGVKLGDGEIYACVADAGELSQCAFDRARGVTSSGAPVLRAAAEIAPNVDIIDMTDAFCSSDTCPPVIGDVLVYRQGSHITNTYAHSLREVLADRLTARVHAAVQ